MARESNAALRTRAALIWQTLAAAYPGAKCELNHSNPLQLLIATILSAQCTDRQVNVVTSGLFQRFKSARDYAETPLPELERELRSIGLFRNKAKNI